MRGIVRAGVDTTGFGHVMTQVARCGLAHDAGFFHRLLRDAGGDQFRLRLVDDEVLKVDVAVRTVVRAESASDAPVFDDDLERAFAANRADGAANHAERIAALAAGGGDQVAVELDAVTDETR